MSEQVRFDYERARQAIGQVKGAAQAYGYSGGRNPVVDTALKNTAVALKSLLRIVANLERGQS